MNASSRRRQIRELIASRSIATQAELQALLAGRGFDVTQATLSRDLAQLGARRAAQPGGGAAYELPEAAPTLRFSDLVRSVDDNGSVVVIHTAPGAAQAVASSLDRARPADILGTIAGDDAIFIAPARGVHASRLTRRVRELVKQLR